MTGKMAASLNKSRLEKEALEKTAPKGLCPSAQGCGLAATLGYKAESRWDSIQSAAHAHERHRHAIFEVQNSYISRNRRTKWISTSTC